MIGNRPFTITLLYCFFFLIGSVYGSGERTFSFGSTASWTDMERRQGLIEVSDIRPQPVLALASGVYTSAGYEDFLDLHLSFNEGRAGAFTDSRGRYDVFASPALAIAPVPWTRTGSGAALFNGADSLDEPLLLRPRPGALFAPDSHIRDFSIEFWLFPRNLQNGTQILSYNAFKPNRQGDYFNQQILCVTSRNRLQWSFRDLFFPPGGETPKSVSFYGPSLVPMSWSHHLVRFDANLGLLEYLVNGRVEAVEYLSSTSREGGEVYTPIIGGDSHLVLGSRFSGMMDEFRIYSTYLDAPVLGRYSNSGRVESHTMDMGRTNSRLLRLEAFGGRTGSPQSTNAIGRLQNEYAGNNALSFSDHSEMRFFIRISDNQYNWNDVPWIPVNPGAELPDTFRGRFVQLAADFFPSEDGSTSPYLSELRLVYRTAAPPPPPPHLTAIARNGAVELSWRPSPSRDVGGYLVYFGTSRGEYFEVNSPLDVGNQTSALIEGLSNGTLYYFVVAAYVGPEPGRLTLEPGRLAIEPGEFSREVAARPQRMIE